MDVNDEIKVFAGLPDWNAISNESKDKDND